MYTSKEQIFPGMWKYSGVFTKEMDLINRIEKEAESNNCKWSPARLGHEEEDLDYRDCFDFKMSDLGTDHDLYKTVYDAQYGPLQDYAEMHTIQLNYWEWTNVIKYLPGQYFKEHADHGWSYVSTVSLVGYPNGDYEGGELHFPKLNITIKPEEGDLYIFPSSYIYSHSAFPVVSGVKYCFATMTDYTDDAHTEQYERYIENKYYKKEAK